jgi:deoxyribonuclease-4
MPKPVARPLIGAHMSIAGGLHLAFERGQKVGCVALQLFQRPNLQWRAAPLTDDKVAAYEAARAASGLGPVIAHAGYLINLASDNAGLRQRSQAVFVDEMRRAARLRVLGVVLHPGTAVDREAAIARIVEGLDRALDATVGSAALVLLETSAGAGTSACGRFEDLAEIIARVQAPDRLGVCFDTCHVFTAGYDLRTPTAYEATLHSFDRVVGLARLRVVHANDSKGDLGGHLDRHEHIGRGRIGEAFFRLLMTDPRFADVPKIIETPKHAGRRKMDPINLRMLRRLAEP